MVQIANTTTIVAGNWKLNGDNQFTQRLLSDLKQGANELPSVAKMLVFPPLPYLTQAINLLKGTGIDVGAQNVSQYEQGAYTGEVSAAMLADIGVQYTLVGHSERRALFGESNEVVARKCQAALSVDITPVVCVGETLQERQAGNTLAVVTEQLNAVFALICADAIEKIIVAYEPVWAIGTGETAAPEDAQAVHQGIRKLVSSINASAAAKLVILYGGSVTEHSAKALFAQPDINGGLVGGASLKASAFISIGQAIA